MPSKRSRVGRGARSRVTAQAVELFEEASALQETRDAHLESDCGAGASHCADCAESIRLCGELYRELRLMPHESTWERVSEIMAEEAPHA